MLYNDEAPFHGRNKKYIGIDLIYVASKWFHATTRGTGQIFGGESNANAVLEILQTVMTSGVSTEKAEECAALRMRITQMLR